MPRASLPIDRDLPRIVETARAHAALVLCAPPGAGKTTRVPPALLDAGLASGAILLIEPRRLAARAAARRMALERGQEVGADIGYQVRFDRRIGPRTRICAVTPGILLRRLQEDPFLTEVALVIFDEFHERGVEIDLALGMLRLVQQSVRPELKLIVMSATLAAPRLPAYLGDCPRIDSEGRMFPVDVRYEPRRAGETPAHAAARTARRLSAETPGHVLVFLPGMRDIRHAESVLTQEAAAPFAVFPLHGDLPLEEQDAALAPSAVRKVILATNVAESSLTVEGVTAVVDTGYARLLHFDPNLGLDRLQTAPISRASAEQRAGRAGRTQPGVCIRLWSEAWQRNLPAQIEPEIARVDLAGPLLQLLALGESAAAFPWLDPPPEEHVRHGEELLERLGATARGKITDLGRLLGRLPVHPRLGRLLVEGQRLGVGQRAALAAALLGERDVFNRQPHGDSSRPQARRDQTRSDVLERVEALEMFHQGKDHRGPLGEINRGAARFVLHAQRQLLRVLRAEAPSQDAEASERDDALLRALLCAFPDRLARRRGPGERRGVLMGGKGVVLAPSSAVLEGELFLAIDVDAGDTEATVRLASAVQRDWLPADKLRADTEAVFDAATEKVIARKRLCYEDLLIEETQAALPSDGSVERILLEEARKATARVSPEAGSEAGRFLTRLRWLAEAMPELKLPRLEGAELEQTLACLVPRRRSFAELRAAPWIDVLRGRLTQAQWRALEREAPDRLEVPSGNRIALEYQEGRPPVLAVRIQELFGWKETPRLAGGRVPVLLHLLAPNYRPQQITDDLASFWRNTYPVVRKELRARYPKHAWPEDPLSAVAKRRH
ncbi:MAG: ATP-dependent helicase HrpB [Gemmataceae bacterium]